MKREQETALFFLAAQMIMGVGLPSEYDEDEYHRIDRNAALRGFAQAREQARQWAIELRRIIGTSNTKARSAVRQPEGGAPVVGIYCDDVLHGSKALPLVIRGWHELLTEGMMDATAFHLAWDMHVLYAMDKGEVCGVLVYQGDKSGYYQKKWFVSLGYVHPNYQYRGVYRQLWNELVRKAEDAGASEIDGVTSTNNLEMRAVMEKLGRTHKGLIFTYTIDNTYDANRSSSS